MGALNQRSPSRGGGSVVSQILTGTAWIISWGLNELGLCICHHVQPYAATQQEATHTHTNTQDPRTQHARAEGRGGVESAANCLYTCSTMSSFEGRSACRGMDHHSIMHPPSGHALGLGPRECAGSGIAVPERHNSNVGLARAASASCDRQPHAHAAEGGIARQRNDSIVNFCTSLGTPFGDTSVAAK